MVSKLELELMDSQIEDGNMEGAIMGCQAEDQKLKAIWKDQHVQTNVAAELES